MTTKQSMPELQHLAIIMDGNRRWARQNNVSLLYDDSSQRAVNAALSFCKERGIAHLTLYTLSIENLQNREQALQQRLFDMLFELCTTQKDDIVAQNIRVRFVGERSLFPERLRPVITDLERATQDATGLQLHLLFCYGGQQEIAAACAALARKVAAGTIRAEQITHELVGQELWLSASPPPDLIIRTGGNQRLSNFLLFQAAYSELCFLDCLWPDVTTEKLAECVDAFSTTTRNFGR